MKAIMDERNDALAAADRYRGQLEKMQACRELARCEHETISGGDDSTRNSSFRVSESCESSVAAAAQLDNAAVFDFEYFNQDSLFSRKWRPQKAIFHNGKVFTGSSKESIFGRMQMCSREKDLQHNFKCSECVFDKDATARCGRDHVLVFTRRSHAAEHVFAFESSSAREKFLMQFKMQSQK
jgi:hypothetical protein